MKFYCDLRNDLYLMYAAHCSEMDEAAKRIARDGSAEINFPFEMTDWHWKYLEDAVNRELAKQ